MSKKIKTSPSKVASETSIPLESEKCHSNTEPPYLKYSQAPSDGFFIGSFFGRKPFTSTIGKKIAFPYIIILFMMIVIISIFLKNYTFLINNSQTIYNEASKQIVAGNLRFNVAMLIMSANDYIITGKDDYQQKFKQQLTQVEKYQKDFHEFELSEEELFIVNSIATNLDSIYDYANQIFTITHPKLSMRAIELMEIMDYQFAENVNLETTKIFNIVAHKIEILNLQSNLMRKEKMDGIYKVFILAFLLSLIVVYLTIHRISKPIRLLTRSVKAFANGDYSEPLVVKTNDEIGIFVRSFSQMAQTVQELIKKLKESEKQYRHIFDTTSDLIQTMTPDGKILLVNRAWREKLGYTEENLTSLKLGDIIQHDLFSKYDVAFQKALEDQRTENLDFKLIKHSGEIIDVEGNIFSNPKEGMQSTVTCFLHDITEQKKAEIQLKFHSNLLNQIGETIIATHLNGDITYWNKAAEKLYGWNETEVIGQNIHDVIQLSVTNEDTALIMALLDNGENWSGEIICQRKNGSTFSAAVYYSSISDAHGELIGIIYFLSDITQRKKQRKELILAKEKAEESDRLKSAFLANMSHEIRTPMNGILGFADLLKTPNLSGKKQQKYIGVIEKSGARMLNIIDDIINISKIESGLMQVNLQKSNINEQIEYIYTFFKPEAETKGITLSFINSLPFKKAIVKIDREKLFAILTNLVKNAIKYSEKGSIEFGYTKKGKQLEFYVKDTGIGIDSDRQVAIFERFIQADISDKKALQGAGLGLAISKAYVEMLGGELWVESEKGKGSIFCFTLPYNVETKGENESVIDNTDRELETLLKKLNILIVEDDETSSWFLGDMLGNLGKKVLYAANGLEAVEICRNNPDIDLILMDMKMPIMDGYEATRQIRQFNKKSFIIAQTAFALKGDREKAIKVGCNKYLSKPIVKYILFSLIKEYFVN
ncbi:MAG: PAS domain S-box protein [Flavobacteriaceae bacterium]